MKESNMAENETATEAKVKKKRLPAIAIVGIGCVGLLVLAGIAMTIAGKLIFSKLGVGLLQKGIESKTGVKVDVNNPQKGVSFTDPKTGESVSFGEQKIPDNFPKDFPVYPGSKPTGTLSGSNTQKDSTGFWVIFTSTDPLAKVAAYYGTQLKSNGWTIENTMNIDKTSSWTISKGLLAGTVMVGEGDNKTGTMITVMLGSKDKTSPNGSTESPTETPTE
jgi:hypothetical protein